MLKPLLLLAALVAAVALARATGASALLEPEALRHFVARQGALGPLLFVLLYGVTPVLFLPGLPMTIAAGVLFGPFWGVVYAITGATLGACASFLVARYVARDWVEKKIRRHLMRARKRKGFGWKRWSRRWLYDRLGLFGRYRVYRPKQRQLKVLPV